MTTLQNNYYGTNGQYGISSGGNGGNGGNGSYALNIGGARVAGGHYLPPGTYVTGASIEIRGGSGGGGSYDFRGGTGGGGGAGVILSSGTLTNGGSIDGGAGGYGGGGFYAGNGGSGGVGVDVTLSGTLTNTGSITAGAGGQGGPGRDGGSGGGGGAGVTLSSGTLINTGSITGGVGGHGDLGTYVSGGGGGGGAGVFLSSGTLSNQGIVTGGDGGSADMTPGGINGGGGAGGAGIYITGGAVTNSDTVTGGSGGVGYYRLGSGVGGAGVTLTSGTLTNYGSVTGGAGGGISGLGIDGGLHGDAGGGGGAGLALSSGTSINDGDITGGAGGGGAYGAYSSGSGGAGGEGITLSSATLTNGGTISGGVGGQGQNGVNYPQYQIYGVGGAGGNGGAGASVNGGMLMSSGTISGGSGSTGGLGSDNGAGGAGGNGGAGVYLNGGTLMTSGTISGGAEGTGGLGESAGVFSYAAAGVAGDAVQFGSVASTLVVEPSAVFNGQVAANGSVNDVLQLGGTQSGGTAITLGTQFTGFQTLDFASGASRTVDVGAGAATSHALTVEGLTTGDTIDFTNQTLSLATVEADFKGATVVSLGGGEYGFDGSASGETFTDSTDGTIEFSGNFSADHFVFSGDAMDMVLESGPVCYLRGTRILTDRGEVAVERLRVGDALVTASGAHRPVRWLGSRRVDCAHHPEPSAVWPIRIQAGAISDGLPARDLWLSPGHSILVDGVLIQAEQLVNEASITQQPEANVEYWHVELDSHDILLAEGLPAESYLDTGNRAGFFNNGGAYLEAHPDFKPKHWAETCVPLVFEGAILQGVKSKLLARAQALGYCLTSDSELHVLAAGERIEPLFSNAQRVAFVIPPDRTQIELHCRVFVPSHIDAASADHRRLGVCVSRLQIDGVDVPLDSAAFERGWHELEVCSPEHGQRWSREYAPLPDATRLVLIELAGRAFCWAQSPPPFVDGSPGRITRRFAPRPSGRPAGDQLRWREVVEPACRLSAVRISAVERSVT